MRVRRSRGFTLIEVLVVIGIIALMVGIMMPSLTEVRRLSRRTVCQKCLDQIGIAMHNYLVDHRDTFPYAARLPSWEKLEAGKKGTKPLPSIPEVLRQEVKGAKEVFLCPADKNTMARTVSEDVKDDEVIPTDRYFDNEGISYEWEKMLNGSKLDFKLARIYVTSDDRTRRYELAKLNKNLMWMMYDFEAFHGGPKIRGSQNILYTDLHVDSDKWREDKKVGVAMIPPVSY